MNASGLSNGSRCAADIAVLTQPACMASDLLVVCFGPLCTPVGPGAYVCKYSWTLILKVLCINEFIKHAHHRVLHQKVAEAWG